MTDRKSWIERNGWKEMAKKGWIESDEQKRLISVSSIEEQDRKIEIDGKRWTERYD